MIDASTLKIVRKARKIGRPKLAKMAGLTERQVAGLEGAGRVAGKLPADVVDRLAAALQLPAGALSGDLQLIDDDLTPASEKKCTSGCCG